MEADAEAIPTEEGAGSGPAPRPRTNQEMLFTDAQGRHKPRLEKRVTQQLKQAAPLLSRVLEEGEQIQYVAQACSPFNVLEFLTTGWILMLLKRCSLVVTDRRILHLPATVGGKPKGSIAQVRFEDVAGFKVGGFLGARLQVKYRNGKKEDFTSLQRLAAKKLEALLPEAGAAGAATASAGRHHLCPRCARPLDAGKYRCSGCNLGFKNRQRATWLSLVAPGGGYFYTGHPVLGTLDALLEIVLLGLTLVGAVLAFQGDPGGLPLALFFGFMLAVEKLVTIYHARHYVEEYLPLDTAFLRG